MFVKPAFENVTRNQIFIDFIQCIMTTANLSLKSHLHFQLKSSVYKVSYEIVSMLANRIVVSKSHVEGGISLSTNDLTFTLIQFIPKFETHSTSLVTLTQCVLTSIINCVYWTSILLIQSVHAEYGLMRRSCEHHFQLLHFRLLLPCYLLRPQQGHHKHLHHHLDRTLEHEMLLASIPDQDQFGFRIISNLMSLHRCELQEIQPIES